MIKHNLKIGEVIFDTYDNRWGKVLLIGGKNKNMVLDNNHSDTIITYEPFDSNGECETTADCAYPLVKNRYFWGEEVCKEINQDKFDNEHNFEFFCPERNENCWEFEAV